MKLGGALTTARRWGTPETVHAATLALTAGCAADVIEAKAVAHGLDLTNPTTRAAIIRQIETEITAAHSA